MLKCKICGTEFPAVKENHYLARENEIVGGIGQSINGNGAKDKITQQKDFNDIRIQEVEDLSFRTLNALRRAGVKTLADIQSRTQIFEMRNIGEKSINEITQSLNKYGKQIN